MADIKRVFVEKKKGFDIEAKKLKEDIKENLVINGLTDVRIFNRYDIDGVNENEYHLIRSTILSEPPIDHVTEEELPPGEGRWLAIEYLPGQYDQRADSAAQCIQIITLKKRPQVLSARIIWLGGNISDEEMARIEAYLINPVDSRKALMKKPENLKIKSKRPQDIKTIKGFIDFSPPKLEKLHQRYHLAMSMADLLFCQQYFSQEEKRDPTQTEIKLLDTYWSDHCRHTTFHSQITGIEFEQGHFNQPVKQVYHNLLNRLKEIEAEKSTDLSLMKIATLSARELKKQGKLEDMEISDEINACSIIRKVKNNGKEEEWLIMFKNETHNHPTEIEPFGGAATCLGGAIRDPLSGRAYVYQAMRVTGCGNPRQSIKETLPGKLPQRKITIEAAHGYSSYGNQIGLATGLVNEIYHPGYVAKRMEVGAVIGAVARKNVKRLEPATGDVILLVGGKTGRDGIGGATGSSKIHTEESIIMAGAEVQKGNAPEERKLQRLFRNPSVCLLIKKCNDFGAGGVSVAIGELADGVSINLDRVPRKYEGLNGTELALSESQERMAILIAPDHINAFCRLAEEENLEAIPIAQVTEEKRLIMIWRGKTIVNISRQFLNTHGVRQQVSLKVSCPQVEHNFFMDQKIPRVQPDQNPFDPWLENLKCLPHGCQIGMSEWFDSSIGAATVLMPWGGIYQATPAEAMVAKIPVSTGDTDTATIMSYGFNPRLSSWSPFHGGVYAVVEAVAKLVASGGNYQNCRLSLQEYFEKLGRNPEKWGKPFSALLGAYHALSRLEIAAIGGKDSMSGSFNDLAVPPTLIAFAVNTVDVANVISPEFKNPGSTVIWIKSRRDPYELPDFALLKKTFALLHQAIEKKQIHACQTVGSGGPALALTKMMMGNRIGLDISPSFNREEIFAPEYGSFIIEIDKAFKFENIFPSLNISVIGQTTSQPHVRFGGNTIGLSALYQAWTEPLKHVFPHELPKEKDLKPSPLYPHRHDRHPAVKLAHPRVLIPVFPGTNCEYDTQKAFTKAGAGVKILVFRNLTAGQIDSSLKELAGEIDQAQIVALCGGFSAGDEPDGSGKFITAVLRNPRISEAFQRLLHQRDGLMIGICNGFQALLKVGLVPLGKICQMDETSPTLTYNLIGRHVSRLVRTKIISVLSPWFSLCQPGDIHLIPVSHGEGRFIASEPQIANLMNRGQVACQYVDPSGQPTLNYPDNPNGSFMAVESITSPDGRILGKMAHSERISNFTAVNIPGVERQPIFASGVNYFRS